MKKNLALKTFVLTLSAALTLALAVPKVAEAKKDGVSKSSKRSADPAGARVKGKGKGNGRDKNKGKGGGRGGDGDGDREGFLCGQQPQVEFRVAC